jgi:hypothetical protein
VICTCTPTDECIACRAGIARAEMRRDWPDDEHAVRAAENRYERSLWGD